VIGYAAETVPESETESMSAFSAAGKFALEGASETLAQEMAPFGVRVLIVEPGEFRTELAAREGQSARVGDPAKAAAAIETALPRCAWPWAAMRWMPFAIMPRLCWPTWRNGSRYRAPWAFRALIVGNPKRVRIQRHRD
jgi:NAD(P)-dependent dehydrogenase (short-subunit alcohol dehydrogenase family)